MPQNNIPTLDKLLENPPKDSATDIAYYQSILSYRLNESLIENQRVLNERLIKDQSSQLKWTLIATWVIAAANIAVAIKSFCR
jgi:hypothetical protein